MTSARAVGRAPGRVNLLGEHTDYNDGFVLPIALAQQTTVAVARAAGSAFNARSDAGGDGKIEGEATFTLDAPPAAAFARYLYGCCRELCERGVEVPPLDIDVASEVPIGVGLSSSAALEVATLRALDALLGLGLDPVEVARIAQRAEVRHAGVRCGIMDQMAASLADTTHALFIDTRSLAFERVALPVGSAVVVVDSGLPRALAASAFNERRRECEEASARLGVASLRDVADLAAVEALPEPWRRRARHVVGENARVLEVVRGADAAAFGAAMNASHASLRDDFEVSVPMLDRLVALLQKSPGVFGARLTGAGFGGACVALCDAGQVEPIVDGVLASYRAIGGDGRLLAALPR